MDLRHRQHRRLHRLHIAADDALQVLHQRGGNDDRVLGVMRCRAVAATALNGDVEEGGTGHGNTRAHRHPVRLGKRVVVHAVDFITRETVEQTVRQHGPRAAQPFLGRLEDEDHGSGKIPRLGEIARRTQQHGGVAIMTAAVELARMGGAERQIGVLVHGQGIHVGAQANGPPLALCPFQHADDAGLADAPVYLKAPLLQKAGDDAGRALFLEADFRVGVEVMAQGRQLLGIACNFLDDGHGSVL